MRIPSPTPPSRRAVLGLISVVVLVVGGACDVRAEIAVQLDADGAGVVVVEIGLDAAAVERLERISGVALEEAVRYDDLLAAGWSTDGFAPDPASGATLTLTHPFSSPDEAEGIVEGLAGASGIVTDVVVERERTWLRAVDAAALTIDVRELSAGLLDDGQIVATLEGLGVDPAAIDLTLVAEAIEGLTFAGSVSVAGDDDAIEVGFGEAATAQARAERVFVSHVVMVVVAGVLFLVAAAAIAGLALSIMRARRRSTPSAP